MMVERLIYQQAVERVDAAADAVEELEDELRSARRQLRIATAEMHHALHKRLKEALA